MQTFRAAPRGGFGLCAVQTFVVFVNFVGLAAQAATIDSFTAVEGGNPDSVTINGPAAGTAVDFTITPSVADPVGSRRRLTVNDFAGSSTTSLTIDGTSGVALMGSSGNAVSNWDIHYGIGFPGLHYDATAGGATAFRLLFSSFSTSLEYVIIAFGYSATGTSNGGVYQPLGAVVEAPFSSFSNSGTIGFSDLNQIQIRVRNMALTSGGGASLEQFETNAAVAAVPEPGSLALAGVGVIALCGFGARRRTKRMES